MGISELPLNILEFSQEAGQGNQPIINIPLLTGGFLRNLKRNGEGGAAKFAYKRLGHYKGEPAQCTWSPTGILCLLWWLLVKVFLPLLQDLTQVYPWGKRNQFQRLFFRGFRLLQDLVVILWATHQIFCLLSSRESQALFGWDVRGGPYELCNI